MLKHIKAKLLLINNYENPVLEIAKKHNNSVPVFSWHFKIEQILAASINYRPVLPIMKKILNIRNLILCKSEHFSYLKYLYHNIYIYIYVAYISRSYIFHCPPNTHISTVWTMCSSSKNNYKYEPHARTKECTCILQMPSSSRTSCGSGWVVLLSGTGL